MRVKDKIFFGYSMGRVNAGNSIEVYYEGDPMLKDRIEKNQIMQEVNKLAWQLEIKSKESHRINWHYARRFKKTTEQLKKLLADMKIEYVYQQAGAQDD
jgi:hypothetical protein